MSAVTFEFPASVISQDESGKGEITVMPFLDDHSIYIGIETMPTGEPHEFAEAWLGVDELRQLQRIITAALVVLTGDES